jgi:hypothetical protein
LLRPAQRLILVDGLLKDGFVGWHRFAQITEATPPQQQESKYSECDYYRDNGDFERHEMDIPCTAPHIQRDFSVIPSFKAMMVLNSIP